MIQYYINKNVLMNVFCIYLWNSGLIFNNFPFSLTKVGTSTPAVGKYRAAFLPSLSSVSGVASIVSGVESLDEVTHTIDSTNIIDDGERSVRNITCSEKHILKYLCLHATGSEVWSVYMSSCQRQTLWRDDLIRLWVYTRCSQFPSVGSFTCLSIEHCIQGTLWLYVTCNWQACWDFADEGQFENFGVSPWDRTLPSSAAGKWLNH